MEVKQEEVKEEIIPINSSIKLSSDSLIPLEVDVKV